MVRICGCSRPTVYKWLKSSGIRIKEKPANRIPIKNGVIDPSKRIFAYQKIKEEIIKQFDSQDEVLDLYCGVGFFSIPLAKRVKSVIGIEYNPLAITDAVYNASLNNLNNLSFHAGKVEEIIDKITKKLKTLIED